MRTLIVALCVLCMGATPRKPGVYTVTIKVDTTYERCGMTKDGMPLFTQKIDTTETWVDANPITDSIWMGDINVIDTSDLRMWRWWQE